MVRWRSSLLLTVGAALQCAASPPNFGHQDLLDPTNGTAVYGRIVNETRLVLRLDRSNFTEDDSWSGVDAGVIYDLSIVEPPCTRPASVILWTPTVKYHGSKQPVPFWEPGPQLGWTPFTMHPYLQVDVSTTLDAYLDKYEDYEEDWVADAGIVQAGNVDNKHGWNITRIIYVNGEIYGEPGHPPQANISVAAIYVMETDERPYEFVWWEMVPLTWGLGWETLQWFNNTDVPKSLEKKLLEGGQIKLDLR